MHGPRLVAMDSFLRSLGVQFQKSDGIGYTNIGIWGKVCPVRCLLDVSGRSQVIKRLQQLPQIQV
jgi:hypothetical protein